MNTLLVVDDSKELLSAFSIIFKKHGFQIFTATCKEAMLSVLERSSPDLIILDVLIGLEDGRELCKELRTISNYDNIPIILMSGSPDNLDNFKDFGANDTIEKPYHLEKILSKVTSLIDRETA